MRRNGFTLIETVLALVVVGLIVSIGFPKVRSALVRNDVRNARMAVSSLYSTARATALESNRTVSVWLVRDSVLVTAQPRRRAGIGTRDTIGPVRALRPSYGVNMAVAAPADTLLVINPRGLGASGTRVYRFSKHGVTDSLVISGYGRVTR